jgi:hypothetical protein
MEGTLYFDCVHLGGSLNPNNVTKNSLNLCKTLSKYLFRHAKGMNEYDEFLHFQCPRSKLIKYRILPFSDIVVGGQ